MKRIKSSLPTSFQDNNSSLTLRDWTLELDKVSLDDGIRQSLNLAICLAFLIQSGRQNVSVTPSDLHFVWTLIYGAQLCDSIHFKANHSALRYHSVLLWSHAKDGNIDKLFRLHVWVPDDHEKRTPISNIQEVIRGHKCMLSLKVHLRRPVQVIKHDFRQPCTRAFFSSVLPTPP